MAGQDHFVEVHHSVAVHVAPEQQLRRDTAYQQQFFDRLQWPVLGSIRRHKRRVVIDFGAEFARLVVVVQPVQNGIGDLDCHARQGHQQIACHALGGKSFHQFVGDFVGDHISCGFLNLGRLLLDHQQRVQVHARRFVLQTVTYAGHPAGGIRRRDQDRVFAEFFRHALVQYDDALKTGRIVVRAARLGPHCQVLQQEGTQRFDARSGEQAGLDAAPHQLRGFALHQHQAGERIGRQRERGDDDQDDDQDQAATTSRGLKKWNWLRMDTARTLRIPMAARCLSQYFQSRKDMVHSPTPSRLPISRNSSSNGNGLAVGIRTTSRNMYSVMSDMDNSRICATSADAWSRP